MARVWKLVHEKPRQFTRCSILHPSSNEIIEFVLMLRIEFKNATPKIIVLCQEEWQQQQYSTLN